MRLSLYAVWSILLMIALAACSQTATSKPIATTTPTQIPRVTIAPTPRITPSPTATQTGGDPEAAVTEYIQSLDPSRLAEVPTWLSELAGDPNRSVRLVAIEPRAEDEWPLILSTYSEGPAALGHWIFWWQDGQWHKQALKGFTIDDGLIDARQQLSNGERELGLIYDANFKGSAIYLVYTLWRWEEEGWELLWTPPRDQ